MLAQAAVGDASLLVELGPVFTLGEAQRGLEVGDGLVVETLGCVGDPAQLKGQDVPAIQLRAGP